MPFSEKERETGSAQNPFLKKDDNAPALSFLYFNVLFYD